MRSMISAAFAAVALVGSAAAAFGGDFIQRKDGAFIPPIKGEAPEAADFDASNLQVIDASIDEISYSIQVGGKPQNMKMKSADALEVVLEPKKYPAKWKEAGQAEERGDHKGAATAYAALGDDKSVNAIVRQRALLFCARSVTNSGDLARAEAAFDNLLKAFPTTFYTRALLRDCWQMWMDAGNEQKATGYIDRLLKLPVATDSDKFEARFALNTIALRKAAAAKDVPGIQKCLEEYKGIASDTEGKAGMGGLNQLARAGQGNCHLELGNLKDARSIFEDLTEHGTGNPVLASACNGLGECWYRANDVKGYTEARRCFLRTELMYAEGAPPDVVAKAIYFAGDCFSRLQDNDAWKDRARTELTSCMKRFPTSPWANKAKQLLGTIPR